MRLVSDKDHESICRGKLETLGPSVFLLSYFLFYENLVHRTGATIYRRAQLSNEMIAEYKHVAQSNDSRRPFQAFTFCSRNCKKAEQFGSIIFVINPEKRTSHRILNMNISFLSAYPEEEEEVLIRPG